MDAVARLRHRPATAALAAWTLFVWTTRIRNIWGDDSLATSERLLNTLLPLSFTVLAVAALATVCHPAARARARAATRPVDALAAWTVAVWAIRFPAILLHDHEAAFTVVHGVLAVVSVVLALLAVREARRVPVEPSDRTRAPAPVGTQGADPGPFAG